MTSLANLSRKELLATCELLISEVGTERAQSLLAGVVKSRQIAIITAASQEAAQPSKKQRKEFDFSRYPQRQVAFWVGYFGEKYNGLATSALKSPRSDGTVEWSFLDALRKVKLIDANGDFESWSYSRCGRTDTGVSALGQVISVRVRCTEGEKDMDYASMLNNNLPEDILVLAWALVDEGSKEPGNERPPFNARFQCKTRTYRYFFRPANLDLEKMKDACSRLEGTHDFRNFCKVDLDNARTFERTIESCKVVTGQCLHPDVHFVEVRGSAFLWHQIRIIMAVLFHVGAGLEEPSIVDDLLDIQKYPGRPSFAMAADLPLLLYSSAYEPDALKWRFSEKSLSRTISQLHNRLGRDMIRCELTKSFLDVLTSDPFPKVTNINDMDYDECSSLAKRQRSKKFTERIQCKSVDERMKERDAGDKARKATEDTLIDE